MKRSPLKRKTILRSKGRKLDRIVIDLRQLVPRKGARSAYARRHREVEYMGWVKTLPCLLSGKWGAIMPIAKLTPCGGIVEADHAGDRGLGQKAPDSTCIPMCTKHHRERTDSSSNAQGAFGRFRSPEMRGWRHASIERVQRHAFRVGVPVPDDRGRCAGYLGLIQAHGEASAPMRPR